MAKNDKKKPKKDTRSPKQRSTEERDIHTPIIQDLIAGIRFSDISKTHSISVAQISNIYTKYRSHIDEERQALLKAREERIAQAFEEERERTARLIGKTGKLMEEALDAAIKSFHEGKAKVVKTVHKRAPDGKTVTITRQKVTLESIQSLFKDVRSILIQYQRGSDDSAPTSEV